MVLGEDAVKTKYCYTVVGRTQHTVKVVHPYFQEGIVFLAVDKQHEGCLDEVSDKSAALQNPFHSGTGDHDSIARLSCRMITVSPRQGGVSG